MRRSSLLPLLPCSALILLASGCARHYYPPPPPPPPPPQAYLPPPLIQQAERLGFDAGQQDASRDRYEGTGYHPKQDARFHDTPGYDPRLGPYPPFRDSYRRAYLRGYDIAFRGR